MTMTLLGTHPPAWRRLEVPVAFTLRRLHAAIQAVMGWKPRSDHRFQVGARIYGISGAGSEELGDSRWVTLQDLLAQGVQDFAYTCDVPGPCVLRLRFEAVTRGDETNQHPVCLDGEGAGPSEDGVPVARASEASLGGETASFNLRSANARLAALR
jgi:hypothetical protein